MSKQVHSSALIIATTFGLMSCGTSAGQTSVSANSVYASSPQNFRLSLTDAPSTQFKSIYVKVKYAELRLAGASREARVQVAKNLGIVDLLSLQNGVTLPMADVSLPADSTVTQIRLVLESSGNYAVKADGSECALKTPSEQKTGIKFIIQQGVAISSNYNYSVVADFDAGHSVSMQGDGTCLLKPVLKLKAATRVASEDETSQNDPMAGDVSDPTVHAQTTASASLQTGDEAGWDNSDSAAEPPVIPPAQLATYLAN